MNITKFNELSGVAEIHCQTCGLESPFNTADCTLSVGPSGQVVAITPPCSSICDRVTFIPLQTEKDPHDEWKWDHNRAMNAVVRSCIDRGAKFADGTDPKKKADILKNKGKAEKRFAKEELRKFLPGSERVMSVAEESGPFGPDRVIERSNRA